MTIFLTKEEIVAAHYYMMRKMEDADQAGIKDHALLDSAVHRPEQSLFGEDAYPSLFDKAAALLESLVKNHCFHNGNKRTAYLAVKSFLMLKGYHLKLERLYAVEFIVDIAKGDCTFEQIAVILREHSVQRS
ncbi:type II toxin-antitoxin system death-on-curing family toxin [Paenibacillus sp. 19GGS1-52]|uniref:type II toxin-antitoxin system death-on-curing family toxin n=1 Tax=Paenibacillus sp. 19GGS1-52 TaxID=2758563 RepID=UPI001EFB8DDD|nr:type II toxin-antitoxin system death-on-curing family toxin [Paenibacillus sp. 19GGS1-52]ULO07398.1 type II toxin-antitoxin system death-on-curing family toxin [Paenibacillus sp. 19GGS1-52]